MTTDAQMRQAIENLQNRRWRLTHLYHIIDKYGQKTLFKPNWAQQELLDNVWYCNIILKARQLGMSTFITMLFLDVCLFNSNVSAGIVAHTREDAEQIFAKAKFAYEHLPEALKKERSISTDTVREMKFSNGSHFRVGTSLRSSTFQYLHISEFGKICAKYPEKAREIITGALNTLAPGQYVFIESTAEGREGYFYDMCMTSQELQKKDRKLSKLDYRFFFFPWWKEPAYMLDHWIPISPPMQEYFEKLEAEGIRLTDAQKFWYASKKKTQGEDMLREYPSTPEEAFLASSEGLYYGSQMVRAIAEKRICHVPHDEAVPCYTAWDLGYNDSTAIWIYQIVNKEIHLIEYIEDSGKSLTHYLNLLSKKPYTFEKHFVPHDASAHELSTGMSRVEVARDLGYDFTVAPKLPILEGIDVTRTILPRCWFDEEKCSQGLSALQNYKKEWNDRLGCWGSKPLHNASSHGSDAFRILATTMKMADRKHTSAEELDRSYREAMGFGEDLPSPFQQPKFY